MASSLKNHVIGYDDSGRMNRYQLGGLYRDLRYDAADRITSYTHILATDGTAQTAFNQTFGYDQLGRITNVSSGGSSWTIGYDANGNRTSVTLNGAASTYATAATSNRLNSITNPARSFTYDEAGNTKQDTGKAFTATYDLSGRMITLVKGGVTTTYTYDSFGRRVRKASSTGAASTVIFVYDQQGQLLGEYNSAGSALREYVWLGTKPIAMFTPDAANAANPPIAYYIHADHLDTPRIVSDKNDKRRWKWLAEPFGTSAPETNPDSLGVFTQNLRFPGQYADAESGLFYNTFRDYDVSTGRYTQSDPIGLSGGINSYAYTGGNPVQYVDPQGLSPCRTVLSFRFVTILHCPPPPPIPGRPSDITPSETRYYDRHCKNSDDPCSALKLAANQAIAQARIKMNKMLGDDPVNGLYRNAYSIPNPGITGTNTTWQGHADDLDGRIGSIWTMIGLGRKMGCDMSMETAAAMTLLTPGAPFP
jgi:RHS repeat-associated protein